MANREMKDSGVEWIGKIPKHWEVMTLKRSTISVKGGIWGEEEKKDENDIPCVRITDFDRSNYTLLDKDLILRNLPQEKQKDYILNKGDLLIEKSGGGAKTPVGQVVIYNKDYPAIYTNFTAKIEINKQIVSSEYFNYLNATLYNLGITVRSIKQTTGIQNLDLNNYLMEKASFPTIEEQQKIAAFLDEKVAHIDNIIEDTKISIENLKAYKQSLITETVTKGLSPDVETKDSGVEWFGRIPSHWKVSKVGNVFEVILGKMLSTFPKESNWTEERYLSAINVHFEGVETFNLKKMWFSPVEKEKLEVKFGDLLVVEGGAGAGGSALYLSEEKGIYVQNSINIVRPKANLSNTSFAYYIFYCLVKNGYVDYVSNKATIPHFTKEKVQSVPYPIIPLNEQQVIVEFLDERTKQVDSLIDQKEQLVIELESYKKSLIYEYVTGKKEVN
ncbi:restriction endonuclease subunit S [Aerococcus viridans]|uniref:restriction endonuclease subunit S n=1 Tax=Aerococcus viridans TaxID=1377 RepID=UPI003B2170A9